LNSSRRRSETLQRDINEWRELKERNAKILGGIDALTGKVAQAEATVKHAFSALENAVQHSIIAAYQCKGDCYIIP
jgi:hypothetical protein